MSSRLEDQRRFINLWILRTSIGLSLASILIGLSVFLTKGANYTPHTPAGSIASIIVDAWQDALSLHASAFLDFGMLVILFTPLVRLGAGIVASMRARDWLYVLTGLVVVALVSLGMLTGQAGG
ncbi:MAG TPA: DUF1634 domain-containing protein [Gammaproteobacteria bacterium]|nr:DUF1634 domain-containing protein [Gammaproteobacteria bacterium]